MAALSPDEFQAKYLDPFSKADFLRSAADIFDGKGDDFTFRPARSWSIRIAGELFAHRLLVAMTAKRMLNVELTSAEDFSGIIGERCEWWFRDHGFEIVEGPCSLDPCRC